MAKIEDLIKQIPDAKLRSEVAREVAALKSTKKFGLVFEEHIPEQVQFLAERDLQAAWISAQSQSVAYQEWVGRDNDSDV
jgi:hypothetical protein